MKKANILMIMVVLFPLTIPSYGQEYGGLMIDYELPGQGLRSIDISDRVTRNSNHVSEWLRLNVHLAHICRQRCEDENRCKAWTYEETGPRDLGNNRFVWIGRCHLKSGIPIPVPKAEYGQYISGIKLLEPPPAQPAPPTSQAQRDWKNNADLPGNDYRSFFLKKIILRNVTRLANKIPVAELGLW